MLVVKIELDKSKENYQAVLAALADFDIASASWESEINIEIKPDPVRRSSENKGDLGGALSEAIDAVVKRRRGNQ